MITAAGGGRVVLGVAPAGAAGVEMTTRHACAAPRRLGSIRDRGSRRPLREGVPSTPTAPAGATPGTTYPAAVVTVL